MTVAHPIQDGVYEIEHCDSRGATYPVTVTVKHGTVTHYRDDTVTADLVALGTRWAAQIATDMLLALQLREYYGTLPAPVAEGVAA